MVNIIVELSKYLMIALMLVYTFECFAVFNYADEYTQRSIFRKQNVLMFLLHMIAFLVMYLQKNETKMIGFYGMQVVLFLAVILLYTKIYPRVSRLVVNNMCADGNRFYYDHQTFVFACGKAVYHCQCIRSDKSCDPGHHPEGKSSVRMENILCNCRCCNAWGRYHCRTCDWRSDAECCNRRFFPSAI